ncbi:MAG: hypothetical protein FD177_2722 [Desulfovibrionaceae bacterium]|nr:MAG: hypothetical protein FD177_2722 [Desulfovibrionaceae bacterium]
MKLTFLRLTIMILAFSIPYSARATVLFDNYTTSWMVAHSQFQVGYIVQQFTLSTDSLLETLSINTLTDPYTVPISNLHAVFYESFNSTIGNEVADYQYIGSNAGTLTSTNSGYNSSREYSFLLPSLEFSAGTYYVAINVAPMQGDSLYWLSPTNQYGYNYISFDNLSTFTPFGYNSFLRLDGSVTPPHTATPEPGTMLLMGIGVVGVAWMSRRVTKTGA